MKLVDCTFDHAPAILEIFNDAILHSTALYDYKPRTMAVMEAWFEAKRAGRLPVIGAIEDTGGLLGFASYGPFRPHPAYKYSVEHSVYVQKDQRGRGLGKMLLREIIERARQNDCHMMIGGIDSTNAVSIQLHRSLGFTHCASIKQAGFKFGRWLDLEFYQLVLSTPAHPVDG